jgi:hypothetical protein
MKLELHYLINDIDQLFESKTLSEHSDIESLKVEGLLYAAKNGVTDPSWASNVVMGNKPLNTIKSWRLYLSEDEFLSIN